MVRSIILALVLSSTAYADTYYLNLPQQTLSDGKDYPPISIEFKDFADRTGYEWCTYGMAIMINQGTYYASCDILPIYPYTKENKGHE